MLNRGVVIAAVSALATGLWFVPDEAVGSPNSNQKLASHKISETHHWVDLGTQGKPGTDTFRLFTAGLVDGRIGATNVHGAFRSLEQFTSSSSATVHGADFDARGSRSFLLHLKFAIINGQIKRSGTGKWTGGTGVYRHARGSFKVTGGGPVGGMQTSHVTGSIIYSRR